MKILYITIFLSMVGITENIFATNYSADIDVENFSFQKEKQAIDYVDLFIGTANDQGQLDPSATVPYGMIKAGPDCIPASHVGYDFKQDLISGFSINRSSGTGCSGSGGNISVRPANADAELRIVKSSEKAVPGYYTAQLSNGVRVELTATNNVAIEKFSFSPGDPKTFFIDFSKSFASFVDCQYTVLSPNEICGWISAKNTCNFGLYTFYFHINSSEKFIVKNKNKTAINLEINKNLSDVELRIAVSTIDVETAKEEFELVKNQNFKEIARQSHNMWKNKLSCIEVEGNESDKVMFYTSLYRCFLSPVNVTSTNGVFVNTAGKKEIAGDFTYYSSWSLWDTYRTKFPLLTIIDAEKMSHFSQSIMNLYKTGKDSWSTMHEGTPTTRTDHAAIVLLDAYNKGIKGIDFKNCYNEILIEADSLPMQSPDNYLESAYDYWAVAQIAKILGRNDDYKKYAALSENTWQKIWLEKFKNIDPERFDIMHGDGLYEGTLWQYRWAVPFDTEGLSRLAGGSDILKEQLSWFFEHNLYNHGNQPDIHTAYLFNRLGYPSLTQYWVNRILTQPMNHCYGTHAKFKKPYFDKAYKPQPEAYIPEMDDDDGTMAAWYVLSAMGIYPLTPGLAVYELSTPLFRKVNINLPNGKKFHILCDKASDNSIYIKQASLNGQKLERLQINHNDILQGGTLHYLIE